MSHIAIKVDSSTITNKRSPSRFEVLFQNLFLPDIEGGYEVGLVSASIWNSWYNISEKLNNNTITYYKDYGLSTQVKYTVIIPDGSYQLEEINSFLYTTLINNGLYDPSSESQTIPIQILANYSTLKVAVIITPGYALDFGEKDLYKLLGVDPITYTNDFDGVNQVDITNGVNSLQIHCNIVTNSYDNSIKSDILYSFVPNVGSGSLIDITPVHRLYVPVVATNNITRIGFRLTDQQGKEIELNGQDVTYFLDIKPVLRTVKMIK